MNRALLHKEVQEFISENYNKDLSRLIFQGSPFEEVSTQELATQLAGKSRAEKKLPTWFRTEGMPCPKMKCCPVYPTGQDLSDPMQNLTSRD